MSVLCGETCSLDFQVYVMFILLNVSARGTCAEAERLLVVWTAWVLWIVEHSHCNIHWSSCHGLLACAHHDDFRQRKIKQEHTHAEVLLPNNEPQHAFSFLGELPSPLRSLHAGCYMVWRYCALCVSWSSQCAHSCTCSACRRQQTAPGKDSYSRGRETWPSVSRLL